MTSAPPAATDAKPMIRVRDLVVAFGERTVLDHVSIDVARGEIMGFVGASGSGKTVLLRSIVGLLPRKGGEVEIAGRDLATMSDEERRRIEQRWGILFQQGALFSSLTAGENVEFPMREHLDIPDRLRKEIALMKLAMVGLSPADARKMPSELSGGMTKRVALARALALDPDIVFLDEPTSGLDPLSAAEFDALIATLQRTLGLTVFMVTHDLSSLRAVCDRIAVLARGKIVALGTMADMQQSADPWVRAYFGVRPAREGSAPAAAERDVR